ncbi:MAG: hypothetical protein ACKO26_10420 [Planctomycetota bacterium]
MRWLAGMLFKADDPEANPEVVPVEEVDGFHTLPLERLVRMKLDSFRLEDRVQVLDMIGVGLVDASLPGRFPGVLADRLRSLLDNPGL